MKHKNLVAGDTRQIGDEVKRNEFDGKVYLQTFKQRNQKEFTWRPVTLIGHKILQSDLIIDKFRREIV